MKGFLTVFIFCLILASIGSLMIVLPLFVIIIASPIAANFMDLAWYWHVGIILYLIISLKIMFKMSKWLSNWICNLFN